MKYPPTLTEAETVERAIAGANLARYGDGEYNLCIGRDCTSQKRDKSLAAELRAILEKAPPGCLPCVTSPYGGTPKQVNWQRYENYDIAIGKQEFGSAFITRPDSAPWIDNAAYWNRISDLWRGKDITLVKGSQRSLRDLPEAKSVRTVWGTYRDAYNCPPWPPEHAHMARRDHPECFRTIDGLMEAIGTPSGTVLLCLGPTATAMAARLAKKSVHAVDLGHLGMYMRHAGAYIYKPTDLASEKYREVLKAMHDGQKAWGSSGHTHAEAVHEFAEELQADAILDYGCGSRSLEAKMKDISPRRVVSYDAAFGGIAKPMDMVACTDVLEHVEPDKLDNVLHHIRALTAKGAYFNIATSPARDNLPDGRNAHLIVQPPEWWINKLESIGWKHARPPVQRKGVTMWLLR